MARLFVCGDIHGCLDELEKQLRRVNFDKAKDQLWALGDLVDRGPKSAEVVMLLDEQWFNSIKGNHEELMEQAYLGNGHHHVINGGGWFVGLSEERQKELYDKVHNLPIAVTLITPMKRRIGLVHAEPVGTDWEMFVSMIETPQIRDMALWNRDRVRQLQLEPMRGVDMVYMGHTPLRAPRQTANFRWIDTGCFATGNLTLEELL